MADTKISALTSQSAADVDVLNDVLPLVDTSVTTTEKITPSALRLAVEGEVNVVGATGATETLTNAPVQKMTMDQNCTFTFPTPTTVAHTFILYIAGAFTPTFPASVDWAGAAAPTYGTPSIYVFHTNDTGTTWFGALFGGAGGFG